MTLTPFRLVVAAATATALAVALVPTIKAYSTYGKWPTLNVPIYVNPTNADVSSNAAISALQGGMAVWNTQSGTPFRFSYAGQVNDANISLDRRNVILFRKATNGAAIASEYSWRSGGDIVDADIIFWDAAFKFFTGSGGCSSGAYIEDISAHELGHALGLLHSNVGEATMYPSYSTCSMSQRTLASDDVAGAKKLYGTGGAAPAPTAPTDTAPIVTIQTPQNGASITAGTAILFSGSATDTPDGNLSSRLVWRSNIDGQLGTGASLSKPLTAGSHTITASATDSTGHTSSRSISVASGTQALASATLRATARTAQDGSRSTVLEWSGLVSTRVDIHRNNVKIATKTNDGSATDPVSARGTYTYKVCKESTSTCTNQASVTF